MAQTDWTYTKSDPSISFSAAGNYLIANAATPQTILYEANPAVSKLNIQWQCRMVRGGLAHDIYARFVDVDNNYQWRFYSPSNGSNQYYNFQFLKDGNVVETLINRYAGWSMYGNWTWFRGNIVDLADGSAVCTMYCNKAGGGYVQEMEYIDVHPRAAGNYGFRLNNFNAGNSWWVDDMSFGELI